MKKIAVNICACIFLFLCMVVPINAADEISIATLAQPELESFTKQIGFLLSRRQYNGAAPLGLVGFNLGVEATAVKLKNTSIWDSTFSSTSSPSYLLVPVAHLNKGLPLGIDVGVRGAVIPTTKLSLWGAEIRYAILKGSVATPALNVFYSYSALKGAKNFDLNSMSLGSSISKGFANITPYAGISMDQNKLTVNSSSLPLSDVTKKSLREFVGLRINLLVLKLCAEVNFGEMQSYGLSLDFGI